MVSRGTAPLLRPSTIIPGQEHPNEHRARGTSKRLLDQYYPASQSTDSFTCYANLPNFELHSHHTVIGHTYLLTGKTKRYCRIHISPPPSSHEGGPFLGHLSIRWLGSCHGAHRGKDNLPVALALHGQEHPPYRYIATRQAFMHATADKLPRDPTKFVLVVARLGLEPSCNNVSATPRDPRRTVYGIFPSPGTHV